MILRYLKIVALVGCVMGLSACGTIGGAMSGAGQDLQKAGEWIKNK